MPFMYLAMKVTVTPSAAHWSKSMTNEDRFYAAFMAATLLIVFAVAWWWLPQKWQACQKLYDNRPAQIFCLLSK
jgi:hypothetical protein